MKTLLTLILAALLPVAAAQTQANREATMTNTTVDDRQAVIELYREMNRAMVAADIDALDKMLAPGYTLTHITGYKQTRAEWLAQVQSGQMRYFRIEEASVDAHVQGERATLTGRARTHARIWGAQGQWPLQLQIELRKSGGQWLMEKAVASTY